MALRRQASEKLIPQHSKQSDQDEAQEQTSPHVQQGNRMHLEEEEDEIKVKEKVGHGHRLSSCPLSCPSPPAAPLPPVSKSSSAKGKAVLRLLP